MRQGRIQNKLLSGADLSFKLLVDSFFFYKETRLHSTGSNGRTGIVVVCTHWKMSAVTAGYSHIMDLLDHKCNKHKKCANRLAHPFTVVTT